MTTGRGRTLGARAEDTLSVSILDLMRWGLSANDFCGISGTLLPILLAEPTSVGALVRSGQSDHIDPQYPVRLIGTYFQLSQHIQDPIYSPSPVYLASDPGCEY